MINFPAVLIANGIGIFLMLITSASSYRNSRSGKLDSKIFNAMIIMTILQCFLETASYFVDGKTYTGFIQINYFLNSCLYIINILFAFSWIIYADYKLFEDETRMKKYRVLLIPVLIIIGSIIVNLFTPILFSINEFNVYKRTSLYIIPFAFTYFYLLFGVVLIYRYRNKVGRYLFLPAILFMIPIFICSIIQFLFYGYSLIWIGVAVAMVSLYINIQNEVTFTDLLSGLYNRQFLYNYLNINIKKNDRSKLLVGIMLDIDSFKTINDNYGHAVGDEAISNAGDILYNIYHNNGIAARYAGDEFILIKFLDNEKQIIDMINEINRYCDSFNSVNDKYKIKFSIGYSIYNYNDDTVDMFLKRMDDAMYQDKRNKIIDNKKQDRRK